MKTSDVMTQGVISVRPDSTVAEAIQLMGKCQISGLPVIALDGRLVGVVTEGDLLRRAELGTEKPRLWWASFLFDRTTLAAEYVHSHAKTVADVMTRDVATVSEDTPLEEAVTIMETHQIKRLPVMRGDIVVGIISRANLIQALGAHLQGAAPVNVTDKKIRKALSTAIHDLPWSARRPYVVVRDGVVDLYWSGPTEDWERKALRVAAENVPGVKDVRDNFVRRL